VRQGDARHALVEEVSECVDEIGAIHACV
jgi:hypothetical protein